MIKTTWVVRVFYSLILFFFVDVVIGGMNCGGNRKVGQNRRALSVINQDLVAEGRPYPCVVNKRTLAE